MATQDSNFETLASGGEAVEVPATIEVEEPDESSEGVRPLRADYEVVGSTPVEVPVRILVASAPDEPDAATTVTFGISSESSGGFSLKLGGFGGGLKATYKSGRSIKIECRPGQTILGFVHIPAWDEERRFRPHPGGEWFHEHVLLPRSGVGTDRLRVSANFGSLSEFDLHDPVSVGGSAPYVDQLSREITVAAEFSLGFKLDNGNEVGLKATMSGTVKTTGEVKVPAGRFHLYLFGAPAIGVVLTRAD